MVVPLEFGNGYVISPHTYNGCFYVSMLGLKFIHISKKKGPQEWSRWYFKNEILTLGSVYSIPFLLLPGAKTSLEAFRPVFRHLDRLFQKSMPQIHIGRKWWCTRELWNTLPTWAIWTLDLRSTGRSSGNQYARTHARTHTHTQTHTNTHIHPHTHVHTHTYTHTGIAKSDSRAIYVIGAAPWDSPLVPLTPQTKINDRDIATLSPMSTLVRH